MKRVRVNVYHLVEALVRPGYEQIQIMGQPIRDIRMALKAGNWEILRG